MSVERATAKRLAEKGLGLLSRILTDYEDMPGNQLRGHVKNITDCVMACVKVQAEEREQLEFESTASLSPDEIRAALKEYLSSLPYDERVALLGGPAHAQLPAVKEEEGG